MGTVAFSDQHREVARRLGAGVQVYDCNPDTGTFKFREPQADLYDVNTMTQRGIHFVGSEPRTAQWADADGSRVVVRVDSPASAAVDAPPAADPAKDVKWLKVESFQNFGAGVFSEVTFVQRALTFGGQPPPTCKNHATVVLPYTTLCIFWARR